jgi:hypothetical protein
VVSLLHGDLIEEASDEEIYRVVMDAWNKHGNGKITGSDNIDNLGPIQPCSTSAKTPQAISLIITSIASTQLEGF